MRKTFILALAAILATSALAGCTSKDTKTSSTPSSSVADSSTASDVDSSAVESESADDSSEGTTTTDVSDASDASDVESTSSAESETDGVQGSADSGSTPTAVTVSEMNDNAGTADGKTLSSFKIHMDFGEKYAIEEEYLFADDVFYSSSAYIISGTMTDPAEIIVDADLADKTSVDQLSEVESGWFIGGLDGTLTLPVTAETSAQDALILANAMASMATEYPDGFSGEYSGDINFDDADIQVSTGESAVSVAE